MTLSRCFGASAVLVFSSLALASKPGEPAKVRTHLRVVSGGDVAPGGRAPALELLALLRREQDKLYQPFNTMDDPRHTGEEAIKIIERMRVKDQAPTPWYALSTTMQAVKAVVQAVQAPTTQTRQRPSPSQVGQAIRAIALGHEYQMGATYAERHDAPSLATINAVAELRAAGTEVIGGNRSENLRLDLEGKYGRVEQQPTPAARLVTSLNAPSSRPSRRGQRIDGSRLAAIVPSHWRQ